MKQTLKHKVAIAVLATLVLPLVGAFATPAVADGTECSLDTGHGTGTILVPCATTVSTGFGGPMGTRGWKFVSFMQPKENYPCLYHGDPNLPSFESYQTFNGTLYSNICMMVTEEVNYAGYMRVLPKPDFDPNFEHQFVVGNPADTNSPSAVTFRVKKVIEEKDAWTDVGNGYLLHIKPDIITVNWGDGTDPTVWGEDSHPGSEMSHVYTKSGIRVEPKIEVQGEGLLYNVGTEDDGPTDKTRPSKADTYTLLKGRPGDPVLTTTSVGQAHDVVQIWSALTVGNAS